MSTSSVTSSNPLRVRDFRLLWAGEAVSSLGDQFAMIALPWLALVLTGSALALGGVMALMAIPRALLMLLGGVSVDRLSPRKVMLASNAVRLAAVGVLGGIVLVGAAQPWMLYAFALVFGVADAFFFPAQTSIVPELVEPHQLQRANGIVQGTAQATILVGPALAGIAIAALGADGSSASTSGIGVALLLDAATFMASLATLWLIRARAHVAEVHPSILESIREGVRFIGGSPGLRATILISLAANLFIVGPFEVGMPYIAYSRLPEGAAAFGVIAAAFGGGSLLGLIAGSVLPAPAPARFGTTVIAAIGLTGFGIAAMAAVDSTVVAAAVIAATGASLGYGNLLGLTWVQGRIPPEMMGRVMSLLMTGSVGLVPVSMFIAGAAAQASLAATMLIAGVGMVLLGAVALLSPVVRNLGLEPLYESPASAERHEGARDATAEPAPG